MRVSLRTLALTVALVIAAAPAGADVTAVTASPSSATAPLTRSVSLRVGWTLSVQAAGPVTVSSQAGRFLSPDGTLLGTVDRPLSTSLNGSGGAFITESVPLPADVLQRAQRAGFDQLFYERRFTDGVAATGRMRIYVTTPPAAGFAVSRLALAFDDGKPLTAVPRNAHLTSQAELSLVGVGLLRGAWEVAGPNPDVERPAWRVLGQVREGSGGAAGLRLSSPELPTDVPGAYLVRLRLDAPEVAFEVPVLRYMVGSDQGA